MPLFYYDPISKERKEEKIYGNLFLRFIYPKNKFLFWLTFPKRFILCHFKFFSYLYGLFQKTKHSRKKIPAFCKRFAIDTSEFEKPVEAFTSFNDFFIRKLKSSARPIAQDDAICFADGRYQFFPELTHTQTFLIKGQTFNLKRLLQDDHLANEFQTGSMVIARLCPTDYHRFHFPFDCTLSEPKLINGSLYSVNPWALIKNINYLTQNKRMITQLTSKFGKSLFIEIGATSVGSITQTFSPQSPVKKGDEKGYFSFGGSCIIMLFQNKSIAFAKELLTQTELEVYCKMGQKLGSLEKI